jgi:hypothetical protein
MVAMGADGAEIDAKQARRIVEAQQQANDGDDTNVDTDRLGIEIHGDFLALYGGCDKPELGRAVWP